MDKKRYNELDRNGHGLTEEELKEGWHFCREWDGMLVGPDMPEMKACLCFPKTRRKEINAKSN